MSIANGVNVIVTQVIEVTSFKTANLGTPDEIVARLVAMGWEVEEQLPDRTTLVHELLPGARRIVLQP